MQRLHFTEGEFVALTPDGERACPRRRRIGRVTRVSTSATHVQVDRLYYHHSYWRHATIEDFRLAMERHEEQSRPLKEAESEWCLKLYEDLLSGEANGRQGRARGVETDTEY